jgi:tetratricopeptide (TPR) repeat protein
VLFRSVADTLIRCAQDFAASDDQPPLSWLRALAGRLDSVDAVRALAQRLPEVSVALRGFAAWLGQRLADRLPEGDASLAGQATRASALNNLANRLSELGDRESALAPAREAVDIYRDLAARNPDAFRPNLAASLNNLASFLSALGDRAGALAPAREAVDIYRDLAARNPDAFRPDLAMSLNNLATRLSELGDRAGALASAREAVATLAPYFQRHPQAFAHWMATMARNYIQRCEALDQEPDAQLLSPIVTVFQALQAAGVWP